MHNNADGTRTATNLFEAAAWHSQVHVKCTACSHYAIFAPHGLWWLFHCRHWDDRLGAVGKRMRCRFGKLPCRGRGKVSVTSSPATITLPDPDEREWKRAVSRFRCWRFRKQYARATADATWGQGVAKWLEAPIGMARPFPAANANTGIHPRAREAVGNGRRRLWLGERCGWR